MLYSVAYNHSVFKTALTVLMIIIYISVTISALFPHSIKEVI